MQGCMAFLRRKRQKTGRSELLPAAFVQFYCPVSGCVSQSSAPRRKNSAAVVLRAPYSRDSITPAAGRTTLAARIARHRPNSTRTSGCTQGAQRRGRRRVTMCSACSSVHASAHSSSGSVMSMAVNGAMPPRWYCRRQIACRYTHSPVSTSVTAPVMHSLRSAARRASAGLVQQLRELDTERVREPLQRLDVRVGAAGLVIRYGLPRRVHGLRQIVLRQLPAHAGAADVGSNVAHGVHLAQSISCAGAICHAKNLCARKKPAEANFCRSCLCSFTVRGAAARSGRG